MKKNIGAALSALAGAALLLAFLYAAIASVAYDASWYDRTQQRIGVSEEGRLEMNREMAAYLKGNIPELSDRFNMQEKVHMQDVRRLFEIGRGAAFWALAAFGVSLFSGCVLTGTKKALRWQGLGCGATLFLLGLLALWAAVDFSGWFNAFHEALFTNDLWLFDPAQSQMIRILPLEFFISAVGTIVLRFLLAATLWGATSLLIGKGLKSRDV